MDLYKGVVFYELRAIKLLQHTKSAKIFIRQEKIFWLISGFPFFLEKKILVNRLY